VKSSEVKSSEVEVLSHPLLSKRIQACLQRSIFSEGGAGTAKLKLLNSAKFTVCALQFTVGRLFKGSYVGP